MTFKELRARLLRVKQAALLPVGKEIIRLGVDHVPIDRGALRRDARVEIKGDSLEVVYGPVGSDSNEYALYQYRTAQRHLESGGVLKPLRDLYAGQATPGTSSKSQYGFAYRKARQNNQLTFYPDGARWFLAAGIETPSTKRRLAKIYAKKFASELKGDS